MSSFNDLPFFPVGPSNGVNGKDGVSPTVSIKEISGGYKLTIVDTTGTKTIDVMNGKEGPQGIQGLPGERGLTGETGPAGKEGSEGKSAYKYAQEGGYSGTETEFSGVLANSISKQSIALGLHTDGLLYLFINGEPVGTGIKITETET